LIQAQHHAGARILRELDDMTFGLARIERDIEGNLWSFGTRDPNGGGA
jgi:hypothetical protein